ncbi:MULTISPECIES: oligosaccharide flippase family protein [unclassified Acinetobacter]|uniref:lipopolysaccharide biosynthesis protein n=1 Tax=unclassified Acinetobacter TaxID=196816 RepID=UPI00257788CC|nr:MULTISPECIES: oligosaccharide flippase family protein [unclassified Acinetobacter]MDM1765541.1 oligosaccharide flippase family protein [Acinetobacter sp. 226-1]MDM1769133.1 oligosaccharide flippase family protein [Acinetobacter sp. 226-4]
MNKKTILGYAIGPIGSGLLGFISLPIITWFYSVEDVGRISMLQIFTNFSVLLFCLGLDQAYVREYHEANNKPALFKTVVLPSLVLSLIFFTLIFLYDNNLISKLMFDVPSTYLSLLVIVCFLVALISRFLSLILRMQDRSFAFSMSQLLPKLIFILIIINTVWLSFSRDTYNLITANAISMIMACLIFFWNTRKEWMQALREKFDFSEFKSLLHFGLPLVAGGLAAWGLNVMDKLFLRHYSSYAELGIYSVTMSIAAVVTIFSSIFNTIWAPMVYKWVATGEYDDQKMQLVLKYLLMFVYFFMVLVGLFSWIIPYFLPENYNQIQYLIPMCLLAPMLYTISEVTGIGIAIVKKTKFAMLCSIVAMLFSIFLNYILVKSLGAKGAAISTATAFLVFLFMRTSISQIVWKKIPHVNLLYIMVILYTLCLLHLLFLKNSYYVVVMWSVFLSIGVLYYKDDLIKCMGFLKTKFLRHYK